jgi:NAD+ synthetase
MRLALCQLDATVGDLEGNAARILDAAQKAKDAGASFAVFPELAITGYPPRDLLERSAFVDESLAALARVVARLPAGLTAAIGFVDRAPASASRRLHNAVAVVRDGQVLCTVHKRLLPTYDVFDEDRWFEPGVGVAPLFEVDGLRVGIAICEDLWSDVAGPITERRYPVDPVVELMAAGAQVLVNVAASPFTRQKREARPQQLAAVARRHAVPVVFVSQVGGQDELVFDGSSCIVGPDGALWARARELAEDVLVADLAAGGPIAARAENEEGAVLDALVLGTRDYVRKCGFSRVVLGVSGGVDSALVAAIAAEALGPANVLGLALPTRFSSAQSFRDAQALVDALGIGFREVPIDTFFQAYLDGLRSHLDALAPAPDGDVTWENVQARIRCTVLMGVANRMGSLLLTTGNKSEIAVGYCTLYGDMGGALGVIADLPKTFVYRVAREVNRRAGRTVIPESTLTKAPSAELRPDQTDQDSLPPYELLDAVLERYVEQRLGVEELVASGFERSLVERIVRLMHTTEHKRRQMAPGLIVSRKAFGPGRQLPIAQRWRG